MIISPIAMLTNPNKKAATGTLNDMATIKSKRCVKLRFIVVQYTPTVGNHKQQRDQLYYEKIYCYLVVNKKRKNTRASFSDIAIKAATL